jgi:hypothetical protein
MVHHLGVWESFSGLAERRLATSLPGVQQYSDYGAAVSNVNAYGPNVLGKVLSRR